VLEAIRNHPRLQLQLIVTGMHLDRSRGKSIDLIRAQGWPIDATIPWKSTGNPSDLAGQAGLASAAMARAFEKMKTDIVLLVGDRVEPFAAACAAQVSQKCVAHIHGGDRAIGQIDDSLRHAISKLAHLHFPATRESAGRLIRLGEDRHRVKCFGAPGIDGIRGSAESWKELANRFPKLIRRRFALLVLHPVDADEETEFRRALQTLRSMRAGGAGQLVVIYPNNDPGSAGIVRCWREQAEKIDVLLPDVPRATYLALLRDSAVLVGNSSSGIIEAASFGTPVVDIGPRQSGRERSENVMSVTYGERPILAAVSRVFRGRLPLRYPAQNVYGGHSTGRRIADALARTKLDAALLRKVIAY
jgi:UDP-N-acetylglucosamine 2-epimerase (non-hydrolysing)/GDP/UDP-N,N'-diacetylbacillosamine 2-epimerase (hydrolysing)